MSAHPYGSAAHRTVCDACRERWNTYHRARYRSHGRDRGARIASVRSFRSLEEIRANARRVAAYFEAIDAADPCLRCGMRGGGYPLCSVCRVELRTERPGSRPAEAYDLHEASNLMLQVEEEWRTFRAAMRSGEVAREDLELWRQRFIEWLGTVVEVLPCAVSFEMEQLHTRRLIAAADRWVARAA